MIWHCQRPGHQHIWYWLHFHGILQDQHSKVQIHQRNIGRYCITQGKSRTFVKTLNLQKTPYTLPTKASHGVFIMKTLGKNCQGISQVHCIHVGGHPNVKCHFIAIEITMIKILWFNYHVIFIMEIPHKVCLYTGRRPPGPTVISYYRLCSSEWVSEWLNLMAFLGTSDSEVHVVHISCVIT